jgi:hypothetical protein
MTKPNKKEIAAQLEQWARNEKKRLKLEADRDVALESYVTEYQRKTASVVAPFDQQLAVITASQARLQTEISDAMKRGIDVNGEVALPQVATTKAIVEVKTTAKREVNPKEFFDAVPASDRNAGFFGCLSVMVGKLEKYRSDVLNKLASEKRSHQVVIRLLS